MTVRSGATGRRVGRRELAVGDYARLDADRDRRTGVPEVILAEGKRVDHLLGILRRLHRAGRGALLSRASPAQLEELRSARARGLPLKFLAGGRVVRMSGPLGSAVPVGTVAIVSAGTADLVYAHEARAILKELGVSVVERYDVGVAGVHRLERALEGLSKKRPAVYLVFAGREGALPTVIAGLVRAPVVGIPTSVGYGRGGRGEAALLAMLQSCAPIAVVNIDAAVPAALFAVQLLAGREGGSSR